MIKTKHTATLQSIKKPFLAALLLIGAVFSIIQLAAPVYAAGETYSYADSGSKISGRGGKLGNSTVVFTKSPLSRDGNNQYTGSATIDDGDGDTCVIGLLITSTESSPSSGEISAPAYMNGQPSVSNPGTTAPPPSCDPGYAADVSDFNKTISIGGSTDDDTPPSGVAETAAQRQIQAVIYSDKPVDELPEMSIRLSSFTTQGTAQTKDVDWNEAANSGSAIFEGIGAGLYRVCVSPDNVFTFSACQDVTKVAGQTLRVEFGDSDTAYNAEGKLVGVTVRITTPGFSGVRVYGPTYLNLVNADGTLAAAEPFITNSRDAGIEGGHRPSGEAPISLYGSIDDVDPGRYRVCVANQPNICSQIFTKVANQKAEVSIDVSEEQSELLREEVDNDQVCSAGSFGWLLCPLVDGLVNLNDTAFGIIQSLLQSRPLNSPDSNNDTYRIWGAMRDIANVVLVIGFIMIIFSQATSIGISNYGIKKLLPRLVAVAILINASWIVMQIATDLANIVGSGLYELLTALAPTINVDWGGFFAGVIGGGLAATGGFFALAGAGGLAPAIWLILPPIIAAALALLVGVLTLFIRQALIIILVVLSPLAIACFLLPGTEQWFKRWQKLLVSMLMMYPLAALVFGGAQLAAGIIAPTEDMHSAYQLVALVILALPMFSLPWLAKQGGDILGKVSGALGKLASGANKPVGNWAKEHGELAKERALATPPRTRFGNKVAFARRRAQNLDQRKRMRELELGAFKTQRSSTFNEDLASRDVSTIPGLQGSPAAQAHIQSAIDKARDEQVKNSEVALRRRIDSELQRNPDADIDAIYRAELSSGDSARAVAAQNVLFGQGGYGIEKFRTLMVGDREKNIPGLQGSVSNEVISTLRRNIANVHAKTALDAASDVAQWGMQPGKYGTFESAAADAGVWKGSAEDIIKQTAASIERAGMAGAISPEQARAMLGDDMLKTKIDKDKTRILNEIASRSISPQESTEPTEIIINRDDQQPPQTPPSQ